MSINYNKLGLIGGVVPASSIEYYKKIISEFQKWMATRDFPELVIHSINKTEMLNYVFNNRLEELVGFLAKRIKVLENAGVDFAAIASNTPHIVFEKLVERVNLPLISIVDETCKAINKKELKKVALFGTKSTMTNGFYQKTAENYGIQIVIPAVEKQNYIHEKYMSELVLNNILPETKKHLIQIVNDLIESELIEGLILGGTELPLIMGQSDFENIEIFDTTDIHVESIVKMMIV